MVEVKSAPFEYQVADCWEEAVELLVLWNGEGKIIAGGQSLTPMLNLRLVAPAALIDIAAIQSAGPHVDGAELVIPATTRHVDALRSPLVQQHCPMLAHAIGLVGNVRVRNRGTIGGSIAHADPTGEIPCTVLAAGGRIRLQGPSGQRFVDAADFFVTYLTTAAEADEVVTEIRVPIQRPNACWGFQEIVRRFSDFATVEVAVAAVTAADGHTIEKVDVVLGGVADQPYKLSDELLAPLVGGTGGAADVARVAELAAEVIDPESDVHASGEYRRRMTGVLTRRVLTETFTHANSPGGHTK